MLWECSPSLYLTLTLGFLVYEVFFFLMFSLINLHSNSETPHFTY